MPEFGFRLLGASYKMGRNGPFVELYGRCPDGQSITARCEGVYPYFYAIGDKKSVGAAVGKSSDVRSMTELELLVGSEKKVCTKIEVRDPQTVGGHEDEGEEPRHYRSRLEARGFTTLASDIPFVRRFIFDKDLGVCVKLTGEEDWNLNLRYTTDIVVRATEVVEIPTVKVPLRVLSFDIENSIEKGTVFCIGTILKKTDGTIEERTFTGDDEETLILDFFKYIIDTDPDIITGYNIAGYDMPYLKARLERYKLELPRIGRDGSTPYASSSNARIWRIHGRILVDAWWSVKTELHPRRETLEFVAKDFLKEEKHDVDPKKMDEEWARNSKKVIEYCLQDARLALKLIERLGTLQRAMDLASVARLPTEEVYNGGTSLLIDSLLIRMADRTGVAVPRNRHSLITEQIEGGYVHQIQPGLYPWVCVMDFKSMYPSMVRKYNICFTTKHKDGTITDPNGVRYLDARTRKGLLPSILETLGTQREEFKAKLKEAKDEDKKRYYNGLQDSIKIIMNAMYGVFASNFYRFTDREIGASITGYARMNIKSVIEKLEKENLKVIYSDTDSVFFLSPEPALKKAIETGERVSKEYSKKGVVLEFNKVCESMFSHGKKKRYIAKVVWPKEEMLVRGYETRRTDSFPIQADALNDVFGMVLAGKIEEAAAYSVDITKKVLKGEFPIEKYIISKTARQESLYKDPDTQAAVRATRLLRDRGFATTFGAKVSWFVRDAQRTPQDVVPFMSGYNYVGKPDYKYYALRMAHTLGRILEVFGWDESALLSGVKGTKSVARKLEEFF